MIRPASIPVTEVSQVGQARRAATRLADEAGLPEVKRGEVAIIATELANNLARYGKRRPLSSSRCPPNPGIGRPDARRRLRARDGRRPDAACRTAFSTGGTPGNGLGAVRRMSADFDIYSLPGKGTLVCRAGGGRGSERHSRPPFAGRRSPRRRRTKTVCGDAWRMRRADRRARGHGGRRAWPRSARRRGRQPWRSSSSSSSGSTARPRSASMPTRRSSGSRGAALAAAHVSHRRPRPLRRRRQHRRPTSVSPEASRGLPSQNGTAGLQMRQGPAVRLSTGPSAACW